MRRALLALFAALAFAAAAAAQHEAAHGGGEHAGDPYIWWKIVNFAILLAALGYYLRKKAGPFFQARTGDIRKGIDEAAKLKFAAEKSAAEVEERLRCLDDEIAALRAAASEEIGAEGERLRSETQQRLAKVRAAAEHEIASATKAALHELRAYSAGLAVSLAEQQIRGRVTPQVQAGLLDTFVRGLKPEGAH